MADGEDEEELTQEDRDTIDALLAKAEVLEDALRKIGLYVDRGTITRVPTLTGHKWALVNEMLLGDVAFTTRVQNPEQDRINKQFSELTFGIGSEEFLNTRERIKKNLEDGRSIWDKREDE